MKQKILTNNLLISSQMANLGFEKDWNKIGGILYRTDVGDKYILNAIKEKRLFLEVSSQDIYFQTLIIFLEMGY